MHTLLLLLYPFFAFFLSLFPFFFYPSTHIKCAEAWVLNTKGEKFKGIVNMHGEEVNERGLFFPSFAIQYFMHAYVSARKRERECAFVVALITLTLDC